MKKQVIDIDSSWSLFLDRDGTINKRLDGYVTKWSEFHFLKQAPEAIGVLAGLFHKIFIVTNQQGIDKELMTHEDLFSVHEKMLEVIEFYDGRIDQIY